MDYARQKRDLGEDVYFLDVSKLSGYYLLNKLRWTLDLVSHKNSAPTFAKSFCESNQIKYLKFSSCKMRFRNIDAKDTLNLTNVLRSQFSLWYGSQSIKIEEIPRKMVQSEVKSYKSTKFLLSKIVERSKIEKMVTINGRFTIEKAVFDLGKERNVPVSFLESLSENPEKYEVFDMSPHSIIESNIKILSQWQRDFDLSPKTTTDIAIKHMEERTSPNWKWKNAGPASMDFSDPYIAFFPTSDYEFSILNIEANLEPKLTQFEVVESLLNFSKELGLEVVVRGHPQPKEKHVGLKEDEIWSQFCTENSIKFISAFDSYDSLQLAKNAHRNVVYYSSIAAEIVFLGYPVIATAPSIYSDSIPNITKETVEEIEIFIKNEPPIVPIDSVFPWAYYMKNGGNLNKTFTVAGLYEIYYELNRIDEPRPSINRIRNFLSYLTNKTIILNFIKNKFEAR